MPKIRYNHDRPLSDFEPQLKILREHGFKPIAVTQILFEDTFVFETNKEAKKAYVKLEKNQKHRDKMVIGWYYGKKAFLKEVKRYETDNNGFSKVLIHWLENEKS